jgi:predicted cobalt transporter CbtA
MSIYDTFFEEQWENIKECFQNGLENVSHAIDKWKDKMDLQTSDELLKAFEKHQYNSHQTTEENKMTRSDILKKAEAIVTGERQQNYGTPEDNFKRIASLWNAYMGDDLFDAVDVAMMMALLKIARISTGTQTEDSFVDLAGYAACGGEIASNN